MAAGLGFKTFNTGDVLSAADVNGYLMQGVLVFADATARNAAITSPQEGQFAYLKDTNTTTYYTGSAWTNLDTTGMVNPMTTTGDTIYSSSGSTPARLGIGSTGQVLTVAGGVPSWATPAGGGGMTQLGSTTTLSGTTTTISSISGSYKHLLIIIDRVTSSGSGSYNNISITPNSLTTATTLTYGQYTYSGESQSSIIPTTFSNNTFEAAGEQSYAIWIYNYAATNLYKPVFLTGHMKNTSIPTPFPMGVMAGGAIASTDAINALTFTTTQSNTNGGKIILYGVS
jgi:hypothetical protein